MGYRRPKRTIRLIFEDPELEGLEVRAHSIPLGKAIELDSAEPEELFRAFSDALISWNLEDEDGRAVPATHEGLLTQEPDFALDLVKAWKDGVIGTSGPLGRNSSDGAPSPNGVPAELSIPMERLSESQLSLSTLS